MSGDDKGRCGWCGKVLPPPRPTPEGAWPAPPRRYCDAACREAAARLRRREEAATPTARAVLEAATRAGMVLDPGTCVARLGRLGPPLAEGARCHRQEIADAVARAYAVVGAYPLDDDLRGRPWIACDACGEAQLYVQKMTGRRCALHAGCPGRLVLLVRPALVEEVAPCA